MAAALPPEALTAANDAERELAATRLELEATRRKLEEAEAVLAAIRTGEADAVVVETPAGERVFTLKSEDAPYRKLVETLNEGAVTVTGDGVILYCNDAFARIVGRDGKTLVATPLAHVMEPGALSALIGGEGAASVECTVRRADGGRRDCLISSVTHQADGEPIWCLLATDITGQSLRLRHNAIVESTDDAVMSYDPTGRVTSWNRAAEVLFGYGTAEALGLEAGVLGASFGPVRGGGKPLGAVGMALAGDTFRQDTRCVAKDGTSIEVSVTASPILAEGGAIVGVSAIVRDIRDRKAAEQALRESEARFRGLIEMMPAAVYACDAQGRITLFNSQAAAIWGRTPNLGEDDERFCGSFRLWRPGGTPLAHAETPMAEALRSGQSFRDQEVVIERPNGSRVTVTVNIDPIRDGAGRIIGVVNVFVDVSARKLAEERLRESEALFRSVLSSAPDFVWAKDLDGRITLGNDATFSLLGDGDSARVLGHDVRTLTSDPDEARVIEANDARVLQLGRSILVEERMTTNGEQRLFQTVKAPWRDASGAIVGIAGVSRDVTEQKRAEAITRESERRFRNMADHAPVMVWVTEADGSCTFLSKSWYEFTGQTPETGLGSGWLGAIHPDDREAFAEASAGREPFRLEYRVRRKDGEYRWALGAAAPRLGEAGQFLGNVGSVIDITDRKDTEERLRAARDTFRHLVEHSPFGIYIVDADFRLVQVSEGAQKVFASVRPLIGRDFAEVMRILWPESFAGQAIRRFRHTLATGEPYRSPSMVERRADIGVTEAYDWKIERITLPDGRFGVVCHFYDLSERQMHEQKIQLLMHEVNHRAKNMLALVQTVARQTASTGPEDFIARFSERVRALAASQDLLVQTDWEGADLGQLIESQLLHFKELVGRRIVLSGPPVEVSPKAAQTLGMAIHELSTNAAKYGALSNDKGRIRIAWQVGAGQGGAQFSIRWQEAAGPPVVPPARTGFGQRIAKTIAETSLSATVTLDYAEAGVEWTLACPLAAIGAPTRQGSSAAPAGSGILIVEDDAMMALDLADSLQQAGYAVMGPAASVAQAMALVQRELPRFAILDVNLGGETSEPVAKYLRERRVPLLSISGYSSAQRPPVFQGAPFLSKPVHTPSLLLEIARVIA